VNTLNFCIRILGKYRRPDLSEQLFHWMRLKGIANEHSLIKLFEGLEEARCPPSRAVRAWRNVSRMQCPFTPSEKSTASLLKTFRPSKDLRGASRILREVKLRKLPLNEYGYNTVIRIAADLGDVDTAFALEEELRTSELGSDVRTYSSLMHAIVASQKWSMTRHVEVLLRSAGLRPDATLCLQLISGYARCGWPAGAEAVMDELMEDYGKTQQTKQKPNRSHWNALLYAYATARQYNGCLMAYQRMVNQVGIRPDGYTMVALLKAGKRSQAGRTAVSFVLSEVEKHKVEMSVELASSAIACCRITPYVSQEEADKSRHLANDVWSLMQAANVKPNRIAYNTLLAARADAGDTTGVQELYDALEEDDTVIPDRSTFSTMMRAFENNDFPAYERYADLASTWTTLHGDDTQ
jgi:pentatricopeptide repeat protein